MSQSIPEVSKTLLASQVAQALQISAAKRSLEQQKAEGEAALALVQAAAAPAPAPADTNLGKNIDTVA